MVNRLTDNAAKLSGFGITKSGNNNLTFNEDVFREADMDAVRSFFNDFGTGMATNASLVNHYMETQADSSNTYGSDGSYTVNGTSTYTDTM